MTPRARAVRRKPTYSDYNRWTLQDARDWFHTYHDHAVSMGWMLTAAGSVLRNGHGGDLDIFAVATRPDPDDLPAHLRSSSRPSPRSGTSSTRPSRC